jgi:hypothetical protein
VLNDQTRICVADSLHTLVIVIRAPADRGRGVLLLNVSETEARVKYLDGFVSVSFFINQSQDALVEYVQWRTPAHLAAAFRRPEFNEHLAVIAQIAHAEVGVYAVEHVLPAASTPIHIGPAFSNTANFQVLKLPSEHMDAALSRLVSWAESTTADSTSPHSVVIHVDRANAKVALFMRHDLAQADSVWYSDPHVADIERTPGLTRYTTVSAPEGQGGPMRYVMSPAGTHEVNHE